LLSTIKSFYKNILVLVNYHQDWKHLVRKELILLNLVILSIYYLVHHVRSIDLENKLFNSFLAINAFEVLLCWNHPFYGFIDKFISSKRISNSFRKNMHLMDRQKSITW